MTEITLPLPISGSLRAAGLALLVLPLVACDDPIPEDAEIIAIGDSIFDWNVDEGASVPDVVGQELGRVVYNAAIGGTMLTGGDGAIPDQYVAGGWSWLVMDGGGNDLNDRCGCGDCDAVMDEIISADGTDGAMPELALSVAAEGVSVAIMGYPELPEGADFGFDACDEELVVLRERITLLAASDDSVIFVDASEVIGAEDLDLFDEDLVHPSIEGGAVMGQLIAERIAAHEGG